MRSRCNDPASGFYPGLVVLTAIVAFQKIVSSSEVSIATQLQKTAGSVGGIPCVEWLHYEFSSLGMNFQS